MTTANNTIGFGRYSSPQPLPKGITTNQETGQGSVLLPVPQEFFRLAQQFEIPTTSKSKRRQNNNQHQKK